MIYTKIKRKNVRILILFIISIIYIFLYLHPSVINFDENFTYSLISHNYQSMINLDEMDVHPPLYYIILKFFVSIFTFWTNSVMIKIVFARLFSVITTIIAFVFLHKTTSLLNIKNNIYVQWILLLLLPNVLGIRFPFQQLVDIRMYSLAAMFIVIEYYYLIKFRKYSNKIYLVIVIISAILASYTHYYAAIFAGLLILVYFIKYYFSHNKDTFKLFISGVILIFAFLPWLPVFLLQLTRPSTYWMTSKVVIKEIGIFVFLILLFSYPLYKYERHANNKLFNTQFNLLLIVLGISSIIMIIYTLFEKPIFQVRYMYPLLLIYEFISLNVMVKCINFHLFNKLMMCIVFLLCCNVGVSSVYQIIHFDIPDFQSSEMYYSWNSSKAHDINIKSNDNYIYNTYIPYMYSLNKKFIVPKSFKQGSNIYNGHTYRVVFYKLIKKIIFK